MIAKIDGVMNGVSVIGDAVGETLFYGPGAGGDATASAVISDIIEIARGGQCAPMLGYKRPLEEGVELADPLDIKSKYYLRIVVDDRPGILAKIASIFGEEQISIASMLQRSAEDGAAQLLLSTHTCSEREFQKALSQLAAQPFVRGEPVMIRIED
jgi:homoserine dehydrogenase